MRLVTDTNIFLAVALDEPEKEQIIQATAGADIIAPEILPYEIGNALSAMVKRQRLSSEEALAAFRISRLISVELIAVQVNNALQTAFQYLMYAYDAYFLQCAKDMRCPLLSLDKRMRQVADDLGIETVDILI
jgi:predicted nucleic acid-binding protein